MLCCWPIAWCCYCCRPVNKLQNLTNVCRCLLQPGCEADALQRPDKLLGNAAHVLNLLSDTFLGPGLQQNEGAERSHLEHLCHTSSNILTQSRVVHELQWPHTWASKPDPHHGSKLIHMQQDSAHAKLTCSWRFIGCLKSLASFAAFLKSRISAIPTSLPCQHKKESSFYQGPSSL